MGVQLVFLITPFPMTPLITPPVCSTPWGAIASVLCQLLSSQENAGGSILNPWTRLGGPPVVLLPLWKGDLELLGKPLCCSCAAVPPRSDCPRPIPADPKCKESQGWKWGCGRDLGFQVSPSRFSSLIAGTPQRKQNVDRSSGLWLQKEKLKFVSKT